MPYAAENTVAKHPLPDGIEITPEQYREALQALTAGQQVAIRGGEMRILSREKRTVYASDGKREIAANDDTPEGATTEPPPSDEHKLVDGKWEIDLDKRKSWLQGETETAYRAALKSFTHADTTWDASDEAATHLRDILNNVANHNELPMGASSIPLEDRNGTVHDMDIAQIKALGKAGLDHRHACLGIRKSKIVQIAAAESEGDLPDPSQGWP